MHAWPMTCPTKVELSAPSDVGCVILLSHLLATILLFPSSQFPDRLFACNMRPRFHFGIKAPFKEENISLAPLGEIRALRGAQLKENGRVLSTATAARIDGVHRAWKVTKGNCPTKPALFRSLPRRL
jgi:hypothetical protein